MTIEAIAVICLTIFGMVTIIGILKTKTPGWGRYSTSTLLLVAALFLAAVFLMTGKIEATIVGNMFFAVIGYAGGLINGKAQN